MKQAVFLNRRVAEIEDDQLAVTVTEQGAHIARILHRPSGISPLWIPKWPSIEPSEYSPKRHPYYGNSNEAQLVSGLLGHSICLDLFGAPSPTEEQAGIPVHGEAPVATYQMNGTDTSVTMKADLPAAQVRFARKVTLVPNGVLHFIETVENLSATDRPIGWTQHVTLGAPFLEPGMTHFSLTATRSRVIESPFNQGLGMQQPGADFDWPMCPRRDGTIDDLRTMTTDAVSGGFTAHLMDPSTEHASFVAWSSRYKLLIGYAWRRTDFPWLARWEENHLRTWAPWNGNGYALGMEFGVSPMVENRREMVARSSMFNAPTFLWLGAKSVATIEYCAFVRSAESLPTSVHWDGKDRVDLDVVER